MRRSGWRAPWTTTASPTGAGSWPAAARSWVDEHLFNGDYYEQQIRPPAPDAAAPRGLVMEHAERRLRLPDQLGAGCQVDQLAGQYAAHVCDLGYVLEPEHVRRTLQSILRHNYRTEFHSHFNHLRTFALGDEQALVYASYPRGGEPPWSLRRSRRSGTAPSTPPPSACCTRAKSRTACG